MAHQRSLSRVSASDALILSPSLPLRPRSPSRHSRSPTRTRITDSMFVDLSAAKILEKFVDADGELKESIEAAGQEQRQFGIRAAVASKKIEEWVNEVGAWPWPAQGSMGFVMPDRKQSMGRNGKEEVVDDEDEDLYWGSLPAALVKLYEERIDEILDDMDDLDIEEIKAKVASLVTIDARPSSSGEPSMPTTPTTPTSSTYTHLDQFTELIIHTVLQALPKLSRLTSLFNTWFVRIDILRDVPQTLASLADAEIALRSAWKSLNGRSPSTIIHGNDSADRDTKPGLSRTAYKVIQGVLQERVAVAGKKIDSMLDRLDGRQDTVPEEWLDQMEAIETDYGDWAVAAEKAIFEAEWAQKIAERKREEEPEPVLKETALESVSVCGREQDSSELALADTARDIPTDTGNSTIPDASTVNDKAGASVPFGSSQDPEPALPQFDADADLTISGMPDSQDFGQVTEAPTAAGVANCLKDAKAHLSITSEISALPNAPSELALEKESQPAENPVSNGSSGIDVPITDRNILEESKEIDSSSIASSRSSQIPPRIPLSHQVSSGPSSPISPFMSPGLAPLPASPTPSLRPFCPNNGVPATSPRNSVPSSPILRTNTGRNSMAFEDFNVPDSPGHLGNPMPRRSSQLSSTAPVFPSLRSGSNSVVAFPGSRSSSISLGPSPSKRRSEDLFGNSDERSLLFADNVILRSPSVLPAEDANILENHQRPASKDMIGSESFEAMKFRDLFSPSSHLPSKPNSEPDLAEAQAQGQACPAKSDTETQLNTSAPISDLSIDEAKISSTLRRPGTPSTPPPMCDSSIANAIMSPSNQPAAGGYSDDEDVYPISPTKKLDSPSKTEFLEDGGGPRSPKKPSSPSKKSVLDDGTHPSSSIKLKKTRTWSRSSESGGDDGSPKSFLHRHRSQSRRSGSPERGVAVAKTEFNDSRSSSPVKKNTSLESCEEVEAPKTPKISQDGLDQLPKPAAVAEAVGCESLVHSRLTNTPREIDEPALLGEDEPQITPEKFSTPAAEDTDGALHNSRVLSHTSLISGYSPSDPSPKVYNAEPAGFYKPMISPIKARGDWPNFAKSRIPTRIAPMQTFDARDILTAVDEAGTSQRRGRRSSKNSQLDGDHSPVEYRDDGHSMDGTFVDQSVPAIAALGRMSLGPKQINILRRDSIVSVAQNDVTAKTASRAGSPNKLSVLNRSIMLESPRIVEDLASDDDFNLESPTAGRSRIYESVEIYESIEEDYSPQRAPQSNPSISSRRQFVRENTAEMESEFSEKSDTLTANSSIAEPPLLSNIKVVLASPQYVPAKISDDQLQQQISEILGTIPAKISLSTSPMDQNPPPKPRQVLKKRPSRASLSPALRPTMFSRAPTPAFTLAPAELRTPRPRQQNNSGVYYLSRNDDQTPIKLFVRLVGASGERVMVRVGGGWADLGEYLKEYASHHGRRAERGGEVTVELPSGGSGMSPSPAFLRSANPGSAWSSSGSRPGSAMGRPGSSLQVRKRGARKSEGAGVVRAERSLRSPSTPLPSTPLPSTPLPFTSAMLRGSVSPQETQAVMRSVSRQGLSVGPEGEEVRLGAAGPAGRKEELDEGKRQWVDEVYNRVRRVSGQGGGNKGGEEGFGGLGMIGGVKRVFRRG